MSELRRIISSTREDVARRRDATPAAALEQAARERGELIRPFAAALRGPQIALIAEHKRRSPSAGEIRADASVTEIVQAYERGGAAALSILTEGPNFGGSLDDLYERVIVAGIKGPIARAAYWTNQNVLDAVLNGVARGTRAVGRFTYDVIDQRIIDGAVGAKFLQALRRLVENPLMLVY